MDRFEVWLPISKFVLGVVEHLTSFFGMRKGRVRVTWDYRSVVDQVQNSTSLLGQDDLFLGALNCSSKVDIVGLLEFLAGLEGSARLAV